MNGPTRTFPRWLRVGWCFSAAVVLVPGAVSGTHLFDSGELVAAGWELGGSHPPGQVLHALILHVAGWLPVGPIPFRASVVSLAATLVAGLVAVGIARDHAGPHHVASPASWTNVSAWAPEFAGPAVILASPVLRQSQRPEVYTLALCFTLASIRALFRWGLAPTPSTSSPRTKHLLAGAVWAGLAANLHLPHALCCVAVGAVALARVLWLTRFTQPERKTRSPVVRSVLAAGALFVLCLGVTPLYLHLRALRGAALWGDGTTFSGLVDYVTARAYRPNLTGSGSTVELGEPLSLVLWGLGPVACVFLLLLPVANRRAPSPETPPSATTDRGAWLLWAWVATLAPIGVTPIHAANPDTAAYLGPAIAVGTALSVASVIRVSTRVSRSTGLRTTAAVARLRANATAVVVVLLLIAVGIRDPRRLMVNTASPALESYGTFATSTVDPRALVAVETDFLASTWMLAQQVSGERPDVRVWVRGLSTSSWHWKQLRGHPAFDGHPRAVGDGTGYTRYTRGALTQALGKVPVLLETHRLARIFNQPSGEPATSPVVAPGVLRGPYLMFSSTGTVETPAGSTAGPATSKPLGFGGGVDSALLGLLRTDARKELSVVARGDNRLTQHVLREVFLRRAERAFLRNRVSEGNADLLVAVAGVAALRQGAQRLARHRTTHTLSRRPAPWITEPTAVGRNERDAGRALAVWLHALGDATAAIQTLEALSHTGDPRAILQLGWLALSDGQLQQAKRALDGASSLDGDPSHARLSQAIEQAEN